MGVFYCIPTYTKFDLCAKAIDAAFASSLRPTHVIVIDNSGTGAAALALKEKMAQYNGSLYVWVETSNTGVGPAWNRFLRELNDDYVIIANDDVAVDQDTIKLMVEKAQEWNSNGSKQYMVVGDHRSGNSFSLFLLTNEGFHTIGEFDETFWPAYFEDNDYAYRMDLLNNPFKEVTGATFQHVGSATINSYDEAGKRRAAAQFENNRAYYLQKWGGMPGQEQFTVPFNTEK